jgi:hypothetical protein
MLQSFRYGLGIGYCLVNLGFSGPGPQAIFAERSVICRIVFY